MNEVLVFWSSFCICHYISLAEQVWHKDWYNSPAPLKTCSQSLSGGSLHSRELLHMYGVVWHSLYWYTSAHFFRFVPSKPYSIPCFRITSFYFCCSKSQRRLKKCEDWFFKHILILRLSITSSAFGGTIHISNVQCTLAHPKLFASVPQFSVKLVWTFTLHMIKLWIKTYIYTQENYCLLIVKL